jgi:hypothetical protein
LLNKKGVLIKEHYLQVEKVGQQVNGFLIRQKNYYIMFREQAEKVRSLSSIYHGVVSLFESVVEFVSRSNSVIFVVGVRLFSFVLIVMVTFFSSKLKIENNNNKIIIIKPIFSGLIVLVVCILRMLLNSSLSVVLRDVDRRDVRISVDGFQCFNRDFRVIIQVWAATRIWILSLPFLVGGANNRIA